MRPFGADASALVAHVGEDHLFQADLGLLPRRVQHGAIDADEQPGLAAASASH